MEPSVGTGNRVAGRLYESLGVVEVRSGGTAVTVTGHGDPVSLTTMCTM